MANESKPDFVVNVEEGCERGELISASLHRYKVRLSNGDVVEWLKSECYQYSADGKLKWKR